VDDDTIRSLVERLSRPHPSGGVVIERAAIMAEGPDSAAILRWIADHAGEPEDLAPPPAGRGLYSARPQSGGGAAAAARAPRRYVLPPA
jgi:hypothetical protein